MPARELAPGFIGERYRLDRLIARGGMAEVWLGEDTFLNRRVAVKVLRPQIAGDEVAIERFRREALACAALNHPNIVAVYDSFEHDGYRAVVMQYVQGKSLRDLLDRKKRLGPQLTIMMGASIAAALHVAHEHNLVHRDVKPGNILVTPSGHFLLADFGIAKPLGSESTSDLTSDNIMMGTAKYLSPEIVRGRPLDGRADLYSLGIVLYECLAGKVPFLGDNDADTALARLQREPTDLGHLRPTLSPQLVRVVHRLLARNPDHRYATGEETRKALLEAMTGERDTTTTLTPPAGTSRVDTGQRPRIGTQDLTPGTPTTRRSEALRSRRTPSSARAGLAHPRWRWIAGGIAVAALVAVAVMRTSDTENIVVPDTVPVVAEPTGPVDIAEIHSYDPNGEDGLENEEFIGLLVDKNPASAWATSCYADKYFGAKQSVGIVVSLTRASTGTLRVNFANGPFGADVYTMSGETPATFDAWTTKVGSLYNTRSQVVRLSITEPVDRILIALTEIGRSDACGTQNPFQGRVNEVAFVPN
jgi:serine/threonine protein kinase